MDLTDWMSGYWVGGTQKCVDAVRIVFDAPDGYQIFPFYYRDYDHDKHAAECAAYAFQCAFCDEQQLTKNQYRIATNRETGDQWIQMEVTDGDYTAITTMETEHVKMTEKYGAWSVDANGYVVSRDKKGRKVKLHRLIMPGVKCIDHVDGSKLNNRLSNLRPATPRINALNSTLRSDNKSGVNGVCKGKARAKVPGNPRSKSVGKHYRAFWTDANGKRRHKPFFYSKHGGKKGAFAAAVKFRQAIDNEIGCTPRIPSGYKRVRPDDSSDDEEPPAKRARIEKEIK